MSQAETLDGGRLRQAAEYKNDVNSLRQICDRDWVAIEACYHKNCYKEYVRNVPIQEAEIDVVDDDADADDSNNFDYKKSYEVFFTNIIEQRLIKHNKVYKVYLKSLCEAFVKIVERTQNIDASKYQTKRLKKKIKEHYLNLIFYQPLQKNETELVFNEAAQPSIIGEVCETGAITSSQSQSSQSSDDEEWYHQRPKYACNKSFYHQIATELRNCLKEVKGVDGWPPNLNDFNLQNYKAGIPFQLFNFLCHVLGLSDDFFATENYLEISEDLALKVLALAYNMVYVQSKGKKQTYKSLAQGTACLLYTSPSPRDGLLSRMPSSA